MTTTFQTVFAGQGEAPIKFIYMVTDKNLATIIASGFLNKYATNNGYVFGETDVFFVFYNGGFGMFTVSESNGVFTLVSPESVISGNLAVTGTITSSQGITATTGNIQALAGNMIAGASGAIGFLTSFPTTALKGTFSFKAADNAGNTATILTNASMGQATTITVPDPGAGTAKTLLDTGTNTMVSGSQIILAKANGTEASNLVTASGNAGVITTSSLNTAAGGSYAITWTNTKISSTSVVLLSRQGGTNTMDNYSMKIVPGSGSATLTIHNLDGSAALNGTILIGYAVL